MPYVNPPQLFMPEITGPGSDKFKVALLKVMIAEANASTLNYTPDGGNGYD